MPKTLPLTLAMLQHVIFMGNVIFQAMTKNSSLKHSGLSKKRPEYDWECCWFNVIDIQVSIHEDCFHPISLTIRQCTIINMGVHLVERYISGINDMHIIWPREQWAHTIDTLIRSTTALVKSKSHWQTESNGIAIAKWHCQVSIIASHVS